MIHSALKEIGKKLNVRSELALDSHLHNCKLSIAALARNDQHDSSKNSRSTINDRKITTTTTATNKQTQKQQIL